MNVHLLAIAKTNARRYGILLCLIILGTVGAFALGDAYVDAGLPAPTVTSDKDDYAPGEIAHITGSGWTLDQQVHVEFKEEPDYPDYHVYDVVVDSDGNWKIDYPIEQRHLGVKFTVLADGKQSGHRSIHTFTDSRSDYTSTISSTSLCSGVPFTLTLKNISDVKNATGINTNRTISSFIVKIPPGVSIIPGDISGWKISTTSSTASIPGEIRYSTTTSSPIASGNFINVPLTATVANTREVAILTNVYTSNNFTSNSGASPEFVLTNNTNFPITTYPSSIVNSIPTVPNVNSQIFCSADNPTISSLPQNGSNYKWYVSATSSVALDATTLLTTGTYYVSQTSTSGCESARTAVVVVVNTTPTRPTVAEQSFLSIDNATVASLPNVGGNYKWYATATSAPALSGTTTLIAGTYYVTTTSNSCESGRTPVKVSIEKAQPEITWSPAGAIIYGNALLGKLNAEASYNGAPVEGTFVYKQGTNIINNTTVLDASTSAYPLTVEFTPSNTTNYKTASGSNSILVNKAPNTISFSNPGTKTFGDATFDLGASASSNLPVSFEVISGPATVSGSSLTITGAGSVVVRASQEGNFNYNPAESVDQTFTVQKANQSITFAPIIDKTYGDVAFAISPSASSNLPVSISTTGNISYDESTGKITINGAGDASVTATQGGGANYNAAISVTRSFKINKANQTITVVTSAPDKAVYNTSFTVVATTSSGLPVYYGSADKLSNEGPKFTMNSGTGTGTVSYSQAGDNNYNAATVITETVTAEKANQTITVTTASPVSAIYNTTFKVAATASSELSVTYSSSAPMSNLGDTYIMNSGTGTGIVKYNQAGDNNYNAAPEVTASVTAQKAPATILLTAADLSQTFDGSAKTVGYTISPAGVTGVSTTYEGSSTAPTNAGSYAVVASLNNDNYTGIAEGTLVIAKAPTITVVSATDATYNGAAHSASANVTGANSLNQAVTVYYAGIAPTAYPSSTTAPVNAGTYAATATYAESANYFGSNDVKQFTIGKATSETVITISSGPFTYTGAAHTPANVTVTGAGGLNMVASPIYANNINAGNASASFSFPGDDNHEASSDSKTFVIGKKAVTVIVSAKTKVYGAPDPEFTGSLTDFVETDKVVATYSREPGETVAAGPYTITATLSPVSVLSNYDITNTAANLTISARPITVKAVDKQKIYGDQDPELTYAITAGSLVDKDAFTGALSRAEGEKIGAYAIGKGTLDLNDNYNLTFQSAELTIGKKAASVVVDAKTKVYGDNNPELTGKLDGFLAADKVSAAYTRTSGENVGFYDIAATLSPEDVLTNYQITYTAAKMAITKKAASVTPVANSKTYGDFDPHLSGNLVGFLANDQVTASYNRVAGESVSGGPYLISATLAPAEVLGNYEITYNTAKFSINPKALVITAENKSKYCGQANPSFTVNYEGFVNNETPTALGGTLSYSTSADVNSGQGTFDVTSGGLTSSNYAITYQKGILTVNGVSIDASASGSPVPSGTTAILSATVSNKVDGGKVDRVKVIFKLDNVEKGAALTNEFGVATLQVSGLMVNVYQVEATPASGCASSTAYLPVYDPNGGFVTGGGWINSPKGAYVKDPAAIGKANFGFVSRYKKGSTTLEGETEFQFQAGNLKFNSTSYEAATLVISNNFKASYRGVGTIYGLPGTFKFTLTAIDGQATGGGGSDKIRMKITDTAGATIYDNMIGTVDNADPSTTLGGGSIVIHDAAKTTSKPSSVVALTELPVSTEAKLTSYPNPLTDEATVEFSVNQEEEYSLDIYDMKGSLVKNLRKGKAMAGETVQAKWDARTTNVGVYIIRLSTSNKVKTVRVVRR